MIADPADDQTVHLKPVTVANTDGIHAMLADGASVGQWVAINLPDGWGTAGGCSRQMGGRGQQRRYGQRPARDFDVGRPAGRRCYPDDLPAH